MYSIIAVLLGITIGLQLKHGKDRKLSSKTNNIIRFAFCCSVAIFIPILVNLALSGYIGNLDIRIFKYVVHVIGVVFASGLLLIAYGEFTINS